MCGVNVVWRVAFCDASECAMGPSALTPTLKESRLQPPAGHLQGRLGRTRRVPVNPEEDEEGGASRLRAAGAGHEGRRNRSVEYAGVDDKERGLQGRVHQVLQCPPS